MLTLGLMVIGVAVVMLASLAAPEHLDPMGMFGLPPVSAVQADAAPIVSSRMAWPTAVLSLRGAGARCAEHVATRQAA
jgi:hypothetical protein